MVTDKAKIKLCVKSTVNFVRLIYIAALIIEVLRNNFDRCFKNTKNTSYVCVKIQ